MVLYVVGIGLFVGFLLLLPTLFQGTSPVGEAVGSESIREEPTITVDPEVTDERDLLMVYVGQSNEERALWKYVWRVVKQNVPSEYTINDLQFGAFKKQYGDLFVCYFNSDHCVEYPILTGVTAVYSETVAGYEFRYGYNFSLSVFANYARYELPEAYEKGILTQEQVRTIWEDYKAMHPCYYQIDPDGVISTPN